jgi:putative effector of murein hydrolase
MKYTVTVLMNLIVAFGGLAAFLSGLLGHYRDWMRKKRWLGERRIRLSLVISTVIAVLFFVPYLYLSHFLVDWETYPSRVAALEVLLGVYFGLLYWLALFALGYRITTFESGV